MVGYIILIILALVLVFSTTKEDDIEITIRDDLGQLKSFSIKVEEPDKEENEKRSYKVIEKYINDNYNKRIKDE